MEIFFLYKKHFFIDVIVLVRKALCFDRQKLSSILKRKNENASDSWIYELAQTHKTGQGVWQRSKKWNNLQSQTHSECMLE